MEGDDCRFGLRSMIAVQHTIIVAEILSVWRYIVFFQTLLLKYI